MIEQNPKLFGFKVTYRRGRRAVAPQQATTAEIELPRSGQQLFLKVPKKLVEEAILRFGLKRPKIVYVNNKGKEISARRAHTAVILIPKRTKTLTVPLPQELRTKKKREDYVGGLYTIVSHSVEPTRRELKKKAPSSFKLTEDYVDKVIESRTLRKNRITRAAVRKYSYLLPAKYEIMRKTKVQEDVLFPFFSSIEDAFTKLFKRHGRKKYFIRILQDAERMGFNADGWGGYTMHREPINSLKALQEFLALTAEVYYESLENYSKAHPMGALLVYGFTIEVVL